MTDTGSFPDSARSQLAQYFSSLAEGGHQIPANIAAIAGFSLPPLPLATVGSPPALFESVSDQPSVPAFVSDTSADPHAAFLPRTGAKNDVNMVDVLVELPHVDSKHSSAAEDAVPGVPPAPRLAGDGELLHASTGSCGYGTVTVEHATGRIDHLSKFDGQPVTSGARTVVRCSLKDAKLAWATITFSKTKSAGKTKATHSVVTLGCLGAIQCSVVDCNFTQRPLTAMGKFKGASAGYISTDVNQVEKLENMLAQDNPTNVEAMLQKTKLKWTCKTHNRLGTHILCDVRYSRKVDEVTPAVSFQALTQNRGDRFPEHGHRQPTGWGLSAQERTTLAEAHNSFPGMSPLGLLCNIAKSASGVSSGLLNVDRVGSALRKLDSASVVVHPDARARPVLPADLKAFFDSLLLGIEHDTKTNPDAKPCLVSTRDQSTDIIAMMTKSAQSWVQETEVADGQMLSHDLTHDVVSSFKVEWYLVNFVMFDHVQASNVPVFCAFLRGKTRHHFAQCYEVFFNTCPNLLHFEPALELFKHCSNATDVDNQLKRLITEVKNAPFQGFPLTLLAVQLDFSAEMYNAFTDVVAARFAEFLGRQPPDSVNETVLWHAFGKCLSVILLGCAFHASQSIERISKNITANEAERTEFLKQARTWLASPDEAQAVAAIESLRGKFPKAKAWLDWWTTPGRGDRVIESRFANGARPHDIASNAGRTDNASENSFLIMKRFVFSKRRMALQQAIMEVAAFLHVTDERRMAARDGHSTRYSRPYHRAGHMISQQELAENDERQGVAPGEIREPARGLQQATQRTARREADAETERKKRKLLASSSSPTDEALDALTSQAQHSADASALQPALRSVRSKITKTASWEVLDSLVRFFADLPSTGTSSFPREESTVTKALSPAAATSLRDCLGVRVLVDANDVTIAFDQLAPPAAKDLAMNIDNAQVICNFFTLMRTKRAESQELEVRNEDLIPLLFNRRTPKNLDEDLKRANGQSIFPESMILSPKFEDRLDKSDRFEQAEQALRSGAAQQLQASVQPDVEWHTPMSLTNIGDTCYIAVVLQTILASNVLRPAILRVHDINADCDDDLIAKTAHFVREATHPGVTTAAINQSFAAVVETVRRVLSTGGREQDPIELMSALFGLASHKSMLPEEEAASIFGTTWIGNRCKSCDLSIGTTSVKPIQTAYVGDVTTTDPIKLDAALIPSNVNLDIICSCDPPATIPAIVIASEAPARAMIVAMPRSIWVAVCNHCELTHESISDGAATVTSKCGRTLASIWSRHNKGQIPWLARLIEGGAIAVEQDARVKIATELSSGKITIQAAGLKRTRQPWQQTVELLARELAVCSERINIRFDKTAPAVVICIAAPSRSRAIEKNSRILDFPATYVVHGTRFFLRSVIRHHQYKRGGHYTAALDIGDVWYHANDAESTQIKAHEVHNLEGDVAILLYEAAQMKPQSAQPATQPQRRTRAQRAYALPLEAAGISKRLTRNERDKLHQLLCPGVFTSMECITLLLQAHQVTADMALNLGDVTSAWLFDIILPLMEYGESQHVNVDLYSGDRTAGNDLVSALARTFLNDADAVRSKSNIFSPKNKVTWFQEMGRRTFRVMPTKPIPWEIAQLHCASKKLENKPILAIVGNYHHFVLLILSFPQSPDAAISVRVFDPSLEQANTPTILGIKLARALIWYVVMWLHLAEPEQGRLAVITSEHKQTEQTDGWSCGYHAVLNCLAVLGKKKIDGTVATQEEVDTFFNEMRTDSFQPL